MREGKKTSDYGRALRRRLKFLYVLILALAAFIALDCLLETNGAPRVVADMIQARFASFGMDFKADAIRIGVWNGIRLDKVRIEGGRKYESPSLAAAKIRASFSPKALLKGNFLPLRFEISEGILSVPVFPESGEEGAYDLLSIKDFHGAVSFSNGRILVERASGICQGFEFKLSGSVDNYLGAAGARGGEALQKSLSQTQASAKQQQRQPRKQKPEPRSKAGAENRQDAYTGNAFVTKAPMQFRKRLLRALDRLKPERFSGRPVCELKFAIDLADFRRSVLNARISTPAFEYGMLKIGSTRQELSLKDGVLELKDVHIDLGGGERIDASGVCDANTNSVSGRISGLCGASKLLLFLDEPSRRNVESRFKFGDDLIAFKGDLRSFSLPSGRYSGMVEFHIPNVIFNGIAFANVSGSAMVDDGAIRGRFACPAVDGEGELEGDFSVGPKSIDCVVEGSAPFDTAEKLLSSQSRSFLKENVDIGTKDRLISFSGKLSASSLDEGEFKGSIELLAPQIRFRDLETKMLTAQLDFSHESLKLSDIRATLDDGTKLSGEMLYEPPKKTLSASMICQGPPERAMALLGPDQKGFIESIVKDIEWPLSGNLIESSFNLHYRYGAKPFCLLTGSLVMTDFEYRGVKFKYGASRFMIDSDRLLLLPGAILETADGQAQISICYRPSSKNRMPEVKAADSLLRDAPEPEGRLDFEFNSALSGNDLLKCFYPQWKSEFIDFPKSLQTKARGSIDYKDQTKTCFNARIQNGSCVWKGAEISNIDASLIYKDRRLLFKGSSAEIAGGKLRTDYDFDFKSLSGDIDLRIQDASLQTLLKQIGWGGVVGSGKPGKLSGTLSSKLHYEGDALLMDGAGRLAIAGADLWSIPMFGEFLKFLGRAWSLDSLGSITSVDCDFKLKGDHFETDSIKSDGGVVALKGGGSYYWNSNDFDFKFRAELLKGALPFETLSRLLTPVSWMLERRLHGKDLDYKWE